jgi:hypothetical protein
MSFYEDFMYEQRQIENEAFECEIDAQHDAETLAWLAKLKRMDAYDAKASEYWGF